MRPQRPQRTRPVNSALPPRAELEESAYGFHQAMKARYLESPRHTIQIDCTEYSHDLRKEMKAGRRRNPHGAAPR